jgi:hypothetical protein
VNVDALRLQFYAQLPTVAAMLLPDHPYDAKEVATEALELIEACVEVFEEMNDDEAT